MPTDWKADLTEAERLEARIAHWNRKGGQQGAAPLVVQPGQTHAVVRFVLSRPLTQEEAVQLKQAILGLSPLLEDLVLIAGITVPPEIENRQWVYHVNTHLRTEQVAILPE